MATVALHTAATGMNAISTQIDVIANNLANVNTTAFKAARANFEDLIYQEKAQPGVENANGDQRPAGIYVGLGTQVANTDFDFTQGSPIETGQPLDVLINGDGFFAIDVVSDEGSGIGFTRAGNLFVNRDGDIVVGNSDGPRVINAPSIPADATGIEITSDGQVYVMLPGQSEPQQVGDFVLTRFANPKGLKPVGNNTYLETNASGTPVDSAPGEGGAGTLLQGFLEASNVDPVRELVELIKAQRAFELNSQSIQAADEALQVVGNLRR